MRFRATVENVQTFYRVVQSLEKLAKRCMITMNESTMRIICLTSDNGVQLWSSIKVPHIFTDYRIQSNNNNEITFEMGTEPLLAALKSALGSPEVVLKLTKKNDHATWSFEIAIQHNSGRRMNIVHDVRITVMRPADVARVHEPLCPEPDVHIILPPLAKLRTPMEHMQRISDAVLIKANRRETLRFMVKTDKCCLESEWTGCKHPNMDGDGTQERDEEEASDEFVSVLLPMKALFKFMSCHVVSTTTIAGLCRGHCVIMYVYIGEAAGEGGVLTFYIPAISDGDD